MLTTQILLAEMDPRVSGERSVTPVGIVQHRNLYDTTASWEWSLEESLVNQPLLC